MKVPVRAPFMGQIELFNIFLEIIIIIIGLKPYCSMQVVWIR